MAEKIGTTESTIRQYELGIRNPKTQRLKEIADALEVPFTNLLEFDIENYKGKTLADFTTEEILEEMKERMENDIEWRNKVIGALGEAFQSDSGITVTYNATGSGAGIQAVLEGRCDIGLASRDLKDEEKAKGLEGTVLAYDGIAIIVNPENPVNDLDLETIAKIYTGEIKNWKEIGGNDAEIVLIGREAGSGTRDGFESITDTEDKCAYRQELTSTGDVITTVASNPNAIGYASLASVKDTVKALKIDGVTASEETIKNGTYVVQRPFVLVTKTDVTLSESAQSFFNFITSEAAHEIIIEAGVVPAN